MDDNVLQGKTLLVVDDEVDLRDIVASELEFMGGKVYQAENISVAKDVLSKHKIDLIVSDIRMPGGTGIDLLDSIKLNDVNHPPIVLITGFADITVQQAFDKGAEALMNKPFKLDDLIQVAARLTGPLKERFQVTGLTDSQSLSLTYDHPLNQGSNFVLGRGGASLSFYPDGCKYELGEVIKIDLQFTDKKLSGQVICRWIKHPESHGGHICLGLEFMNLDQSSLDIVIANFHDGNTKALIPSL